jgi:hypothetical protein
MALAWTKAVLRPANKVENQKRLAEIPPVLAQERRFALELFGA